MIQVPQSILCADLNTLINRVYPRISHQEIKEDQYFLDCIILCSRNDEVHNINEAILQQFNLVPNAEVHMLRSVDSVSEEDKMHHVYSVVFSTTQQQWIASCFTLSQGQLSSYLTEELGSRRRTLQWNKNNSVECEKKGAPVQDYQQGQKVQRKSCVDSKDQVII